MIHVALASFGMSGKVFHAPFITHHPHFQLSAVVERHNNESKELYPQSRLYRSVEEMLQDPIIDLVVVNTPVQTHYEYAYKALLAGKNVLVEKPFTISVSEAEQLTRLAKEQGKLLIVFQNRRYDGDYLKVKEIVLSKIPGATFANILEFDKENDFYRGEVKYRNMTYNFKINPYNGKIIEWEENEIKIN